MSKTTHDPEPWFVDNSRGYEEFKSVIASRQPPEGDDRWIVPADDDADARRIVACVNACAGIPTEALERGALGRAIQHIANLSANTGFPGSLRDDLASLARVLGRLPP
jgi:hypothetical protein